VSIADAVAAVMFAGVVVYAVLGGADFGSGVWDLLAGGAQRGERTRRLIDHAIGPVWEANHVWLIFVLVFLWTGFPEAFAAMMTSLSVPFWLVGLGVVLRGAGFALRKYTPTIGWARVAGVVFAAASLLTPFFLGSIAGAVSSGRVGLDGTAARHSTAFSPTSLLGGVLAVLTCTFLAGVFLAAEADRLGDKDLAHSMSRRSIVAGAVTGVVAVVGIIPIEIDAPTLAHGLTGRAVGIVIVSAAAGLTTMWLLIVGRLRPARVSAVIAVASITIGWGVAQYPWVLVDELTIKESAGAHTTLVGLTIAAGLAAVLILPALAYLFVLADTNRLGEQTGGTSRLTFDDEL